jgi:hypothetical protein
MDKPDRGSIEKRHRMDKPETQAPLRQDTKWTNIACFYGLSIMCLVTIMPVSLVCPLCILSQYCLCLWFIHHVSCLNIACVSGLNILSSIRTSQREWTKQTQRHYWDRTQNGQTRDTGKHWDKAQRMNKPEIQTLLRQDTEWTNQRRMSLNIACFSGFSILCLVSILPPVSLVCPFCVLSQYCLFLWFVNSLCLVSILPVSYKMNKPETQAVLGQDSEWSNQRHMQYWDKTHDG